MRFAQCREVMVPEARQGRTLQEENSLVIPRSERDEEPASFSTTEKAGASPLASLRVGMTRRTEVCGIEE
jgi:hypothetical protein